MGKFQKENKKTNKYHYLMKSKIKCQIYDK